MGGGLALYESGEQFQKAVDQLDNVKFFIILSDISLFDVEKLYIVLYDEVSSFLKTNGVRYSQIDVSGLGGGGGMQTIFEIFKLFWEKKDVIAFLASIFTEILKPRYIKYLHNKVYSLKPKVELNISIEADTDIDKIEKGELKYILSSKLTNLLFISDSISQILQDKHKYLSCDLLISVRLNSKNYSASFSIPNKFQKNSNYSRLINIFNDLTIKSNYHIDFAITPLFAIRRLDYKISRSDNSYEKRLHKTYFFLFSSRVINDYYS